MKGYLSAILLLVAIAVLTGCQKSVSIQYVNPDDPFTGWFKVVSARNKRKSSEIIIPIFKIDETYYSVCRGFEIPFRQTPKGLEWAMEPSSMVGTTIGHHPDGADFIIIRDAQAEDFTSESEASHDTSPCPMTRTVKPSWVLDTAGLSPHKNDDFVGCYQPLWFPYVRIEIRKYGEKYFHVAQELGQTTYSEPKELASLSGRLGFTGFDRKNENILTYNKDLRRFEMTKTETMPPIKMPLVQISKQVSGNNIVTRSDFPLDFVPIGIPSWH